jgi:hypothetical protein
MSWYLVGMIVAGSNCFCSKVGFFVYWLLSFWPQNWLLQSTRGTRFHRLETHPRVCNDTKWRQNEAILSFGYYLLLFYSRLPSRPPRWIFSGPTSLKILQEFGHFLSSFSVNGMCFKYYKSFIVVGVIDILSIWSGNSYVHIWSGPGRRYTTGDSRRLDMSHAMMECISNFIGYPSICFCKFFPDYTQDVWCELFTNVQQSRSCCCCCRFSWYQDNMLHLSWSVIPKNALCVFT